jgi:sulfite reductase beta subunit-like hemoprotein
VLIGKAVRGDEVPLVIERLARHYLSTRRSDESFIEAVERQGAAAFKLALETAENVAA